MENVLALSGLFTPSGNTALWAVAVVLLVLYVVRRRSRKAPGQDSLR